PRRPSAGPPGVAPALSERGGPGPRATGRARRDPPHPRGRLRPGPPEHHRHLSHLVRLSSRRDLPLRRGPCRMTQPGPTPPTPVGARRASPLTVGPLLTAEQADAARAGPEGAFLVAAGPGTGKTFTMVQRFRWLVEEKRVPAEAVLTVTFTEAAATELRERLARGLGRPLEDAWIGTFHGVCARLLREDAYL